MAAAVLLHGLAEHSGRYAQLAERLASQGYAVYAMDMRGHGRSEGRRIYVETFQQYPDDVARLIQKVRTEQPNRPLFLFGHSMGGLVALWLATGDVAGLSGVAISAAALRLHSKVFPVLRWLAIPGSLLLPRMRVVAVNFSRTSRDPRVVADMRRDPLVYHGHIPNRTGGELLRAGLVLRQRVATIRQPLLIQHGTADLINDLEGARILYRDAGTIDKTLKVYEGLYHNLFDEPEREYVIADLIRWLNTHRDSLLSGAKRPTTSGSD